MSDEMENENVKKIMFVMRQAPHGTIYSYEGLETVLIMAAFEQQLCMAFIGDGVFVLCKTQDTAELGIKGFVKTYTALEDYGVENMYVDRRSMEERGLSEDDFIVPVQVVDAEEITKLMEAQDACIPY